MRHSFDTPAIMANPRVQQNAIIAFVSFFALVLVFKVSSSYGPSISTPAAIADYIPSAYGGKTHNWDLEHDTRLRDFAMSFKWRMEGFWERMDELR